MNKDAAIQPVSSCDPFCNAKLNVQCQTDGVFVRPLTALALVRQVVVLQLLQIRNADGAGLVLNCL